jgi:hypothetical protein
VGIIRHNQVSVYLRLKIKTRLKTRKIMANPNGTPENLIPITKDNQPSPEAKKKGWERRREAQKILDEVKRLGDMSYKDIKDLLEDVKRNPENHTLKEVKIAQYLMKEKFTVDWLDRHVSKAPQEVDVTSQGDRIQIVLLDIFKDDP